MSDRSYTPAEHPLSGTTSNQITLIVPTRNEAGNIAPLLTKLAEIKTEPGLDVLFVDDSTDNTPQIVSELSDRCPFPIRLLARSPERRNGLSGAVVDGIREAKGDWICVMDADLQHPPEAIPLLWEQAMRTGADMVVGSRQGDFFGPLGLTRIRSFTSKALTILARMVFPQTLKNVSDPLTGLFLVRRSAIDADVLRPDGFKILLEILVRCPALHVSEILFNFAPRNEGESKADVREGIRFLRHLLFLRVTVNPHLIRFLIAISLGIVFNSLLLWILVDSLQVQIFVASIAAVELFFFWMQIGFHFWVFRDQEQADLRRGFWSSFLASQLFLIIVYLPVLWLLLSFTLAHYLLINMIALFLVGLIRYGLSEQWIWTRGSIIWQHQTFYYRIHDILNIASQVHLEELQYFEIDYTPQTIDIEIRLDRQGTPSRVPGGISFDERLGRFGFGLTVLPGDFTQIIVSPLLERSPSFLFTNVAEPVLRWSLVRKGFALVKAASVVKQNSVFLLQSNEDMGKPIAFLCTQFGYEFMADDLVIINGAGIAFSYPKPVTVEQEMIKKREEKFSLKERLTLLFRRAIYTRLSRNIGLWLSERDIPAATFNTYLQWWVPQPKQMLADVLPGVQYGESAPIRQVIFVHQEPETSSGAEERKWLVESLQLSEERDSFQPHPLLAKQLRIWQGEDLLSKERKIIENAISHSTHRWVESDAENWWIEFEWVNQVPKIKGHPKIAGDSTASRLKPFIHPQRGT